MNRWYMRGGNEEDVAVSSRVRLARNLRGYPFPGRLSPEQEQEIIEKTAAVLSDDTAGGFKLIPVSKLGENERLAMVERHLISPELAQGGATRAVLTDEDESVSIMIGEEDHLRIQVFGPGLCLTDCLKKAIEIDELLGSKLEYAFDEKLGYLTKCPTNLGTGMRASVMLHLPALSAGGAMRGIAATAGKLGFAVRGCYGEGSSASGALYQISNQMTLGFGEETIVERLNDAIGQIIRQERLMRETAYNLDKLRTEDGVWRAAGAMKYARAMSTEEAMDHLSSLRTGVSLGIVKLDAAALNSLLWEIQPANLTEVSGKGRLTPSERDAARAELLRRKITL